MQSENCGFFMWHDEAMTERGREVINMLKLENKILLAKNRRLKSNYYDMVSSRDAEKKIVELWLEVQ